MSLCSSLYIHSGDALNSPGFLPCHVNNFGHRPFPFVEKFFQPISDNY